MHASSRLFPSLDPARCAPVLLLFLTACGGGGGGATPGGAGGTGDPAIGPDLMVQSLEFSPASASTGDTLHVVDVARNDGDAAASAFSVEIYLSADPVISSSDVLLGVRSLGGLDAASTSAGGGFLTVPASVGAGTWYVGAVADREGAVQEFDEGNNVLVAVGTLEVSVAPLPDLTSTSVSFSPSAIEAGQPIDVSDTVENIGEGDSASFQVGIYLSNDPQITSGDVLIGLREVSSLQSGALSFVSAPLTVPASLEAGTWYLGALADVGGARLESDEFNNAMVASGQLLVSHPPRPDVLVQQLSFEPFQVDAGESITVTETALNQGLAAAGPFRVGIYLSEDEELTAEDHLIGFRSIGGLGVGATSSASAPLVVPASVGSGLFHVGAIADHEDSLLEESEENNDLIALGVLEVFLPPLPDVKPVAVSFGPGALQAGEQVTVVERVVNHGVVSAEGFRVATYLSSNPIVSTSDLLLGTRVISSLAPGTEDEAISQYTLPAGISTGSWTLAVIADDTDVLLEPNEGDNLLLAPGHLDVTGSPEPHPDLLVSSLSFSPNSLQPGGQLSVQSIARNEGDLSAASFQVGFYLSEDDVIESTDHLIGQRTVNNLGIDQGSAQSFFYTLDANFPVGVYHFGAIADFAEVVAESDESNNTKLAIGTVEVYIPPPPAPDLVVDSLSFSPGSAQPGDSLLIDDVVKNLGDLSAGAFHVTYWLSDDAEVTSDDLPLGSGLTIPLLDAGAQAPSSTQLDLPLGLSPGTWYVGAIVGVDGGTPESDTENNTRVADVTLEVLP
jgi:subtilase family serine protease